MRALGKEQTAVLRALRDHHGEYLPGGGWYWGNYSTSLRLMRSLVRRGMASEGKGQHFKISALGLATLAANKRTVDRAVPITEAALQAAALSLREEYEKYAQTTIAPVSFNQYRHVKDWLKVPT